MIKCTSIINSVFQSVTYFLIEEERRELAIVDCGDAMPIMDFIRQNGLHLECILLTHSHFDHIYGLNEVLEQYPEATVYTSSKGKLGLYDTRLNLSQYSVEHKPFRLLYKDNVCVLQEGDCISFADEQIRVVSTPGHDWSCLSYIVDGMIFTGDSYIPGINVVASWPKSNKIEARTSLQKLKELEQSGLMICPGHAIGVS